LDSLGFVEIEERCNGTNLKIRLENQDLCQDQIVRMKEEVDVSERSVY